MNLPIWWLEQARLHAEALRRELQADDKSSESDDEEVQDTSMFTSGVVVHGVRQKPHDTPIWSTVPECPIESARSGVPGRECDCETPSCDSHQKKEAICRQQRSVCGA